MSGAGLLAALLMVLGLGSGVMVFKHQVDEERHELAQLRRELREAEILEARLRAELAYHRRPAYLQSFADELGLAPAVPSQLTTFADLPARPPVVEGGDATPVLVALPSGERTKLLRRPVRGSDG